MKACRKEYTEVETWERFLSDRTSSCIVISQWIISSSRGNYSNDISPFRKWSERVAIRTVAVNGMCLWMAGLRGEEGNHCFRIISVELFDF